SSFWSRWPALHIIGKDILVPAHGIYWLTMLKAIGFSDDQMPSFLVHGYINIAGEKMSKTLGNVVDPFRLSENYGAGALRYYLMAECICGQDMDFSTERLTLRYNSELANGLGNLLNRTANMVRRYRNGTLIRPPSPTPQANSLISQAIQTWQSVAASMDAFKPQEAIASIFSLVDSANKFAEAESPWKLAKDPTQSHRLDSALWAMALTSLHAASLLSPFLPNETQKIAAQLQSPLLTYSNHSSSQQDCFQFAEPQPVFPRIETNTTS
ncbi:MAG: class I tRNA ligase family protein, partial [Chthoniobacterales bacterium]|nr:class I tRNA ligase family protein [Chthoniobacterales bacterium]